MIFATIINTILLAIATAVAHAVNTFGVEERVLSALPPQLKNDPELLLALLAIAIVSVIGVQNSAVLSARSAYKIKQPIHHPTEKDVANKADRLAFLRRVRVVENFIEQLPQFYFIVFVNYVFVKQFATLALLSATYVIGRVFYGLTYGNGTSRALPFVIIMLSYMTLHGLVIIKILEKFAIELPAIPL